MRRKSPNPTDKRNAMLKTIEHLGGETFVLSEVKRSESSLKDWLAARCFPMSLYGDFANLGMRMNVKIDLSLFGKPGQHRQRKKAGSPQLDDAQAAQS